MSTEDCYANCPWTTIFYCAEKGLNGHKNVKILCTECSTTCVPVYFIYSVQSVGNSRTLQGCWPSRNIWEQCYSLPVDLPWNGKFKFKFMITSICNTPWCFYISLIMSIIIIDVIFTYIRNIVYWYWKYCQSKRYHMNLSAKITHLNFWRFVDDF